MSIPHVYIYEVVIYWLFSSCSKSIFSKTIFSEVEEIGVRWERNNSSMHDSKTQDKALKHVVEEDCANIAVGKLGAVFKNLESGRG